MTRYWPRARPQAGVPVLFKARHEDFRVVELPAGEPAGEGEHLWLRLGKTGVTTPELAGRLARAFGVAEVSVGYAGLKDKHAVTEQWFSVHTPASVDHLPQMDDVVVLEAARHRRKLRRGELAGNRFEIRLRGLDGQSEDGPSEDGRWLEELERVADEGVPNYFGSQRFGGDNLEQARRWLPHRRRRRLSAFRKGLYLSVLRSYLFNEVLARRVQNGCWNRLVDGDVAMAAASFPPAAVDMPSGPLWGRGQSPVRGEAAALEAAALAGHEDICEGLEYAGLSHERRSLVLRAPDLAWTRVADGLTLTFTLPPGCYATTLLGEVFELEEPSDRV